MENPHDGEQTFFCVLDMNTPDIHFNLQNTTFYYVCLSWFVLKMCCLFCTLENMYWFTIINNIKQLHWLSLWLQSKLQILSNDNVVLKNTDYGWSWRLELIFNRLYSLPLNTFLHLITMFSAYNLFTAEKERSSGLVTSQRKVANRKVRDLSNFHPHAEQLFRRICGH